MKYLGRLLVELATQDPAVIAVVASSLRRALEMVATSQPEVLDVAVDHTDGSREFVVKVILDAQAEVALEDPKELDEISEDLLARAFRLINENQVGAVDDAIVMESALIPA